MNPISSYPITRDICIGRIKTDPCFIALVLAQNGTPLDLDGKSVELFFLTGEKVLLQKDPDQVEDNRAIYILSETDKAALYANVIKLAIKLDGVTIGEGRFEWGSQDGEVSKNPPAIGININTVAESIEWFEVVIGPRGPKGKSAWQYAVEKGYTGTEEEYAEEMAHLPEYADDTEGFRNEAEGFRDEAQGFATSAQGSATAAGNSAGAAEASANNAGNAAGASITARNQAETFAGNASNSANAAGASAGNAEGFANAASSSASAAGGSAIAAENAKTDAENAAAAALSHKNAAEFAETGAETARTGAELAQEGAEEARNEVDAMKDSFIRNSSDTFGAKVTAIVSLTQTEFDDLPLKEITTMYVVSDDPTEVILQLVGLTQAEYDGLPAKDPETMYLIEYAA